MSDFCVYVVWCCAAIAAVFCALWGAVWLGVSYDCGRYAEITGKATRMGGSSCYIQDAGQWYVWGEYKNRLVTRGEMGKP